MKFLWSIRTYIQNFSNRHTIFVFFVCLFVCVLTTFCSRCGMEWDKSMIHFELFYHLVRRRNFDPQALSFFRLRQLEKKCFRYLSKRR